jgi:hypothetical protein
MSTMMSEYGALSTAMRDMISIKTLVKALAEAVTEKEAVNVDCCSDVFQDNNGALVLADMPRIPPQSEFFAVKYHFFREKVLSVREVQTLLQLVDLMTKGLVRDKCEPLRDRLMGWTDETDIVIRKYTKLPAPIRGGVSQSEGDKRSIRE